MIKNGEMMKDVKHTFKSDLDWNYNRNTGMCVTLNIEFLFWKEKDQPFQVIAMIQRYTDSIQDDEDWRSNQDDYDYTTR